MEQEKLGQAIWDMRVNMLRLAMSITGNSHDAEDAVSTAMLKACQRAGTLKKPEKLRPWLLTITARCCYDLLRKRRREYPVAEVQAPQPPVLIGAETVYETLLELPPPLAQVLTLYYYEGFATKEIAEVLHVSRPTVSMRLIRGRKMLAELLKGGNDA